MQLLYYIYDLYVYIYIYSKPIAKYIIHYKNNYNYKLLRPTI